MWPFVLYSALVLLVVASMLQISFLLGQRHQSRATGSPYEGGIVSVGSAKLRLSAKFYLIAMLFVAFDLETVFLLAWAVAARELGWPGFLEALVFTAILVATLQYLARVGALDVPVKDAGQRRGGS
ncbi:MAG: NADH-quinone oxidoreductase subunit A [Holophaga sp.]|jgi:NADH-quinone oxidoreductase subunit A